MDSSVDLGGHTQGRLSNIAKWQKIAGRSGKPVKKVPRLPDAHLSRVATLMSSEEISQHSVFVSTTREELRRVLHKDEEESEEEDFSFPPLPPYLPLSERKSVQVQFIATHDAKTRELVLMASAKTRTKVTKSKKPPPSKRGRGRPRKNASGRGRGRGRKKDDDTDYVPPGKRVKPLPVRQPLMDIPPPRRAKAHETVTEFTLEDAHTLQGTSSHMDPDVFINSTEQINSGHNMTLPASVAILSSHREFAAGTIPNSQDIGPESLASLPIRRQIVPGNIATLSSHQEIAADSMGFPQNLGPDCPTSFHRQVVVSGSIVKSSRQQISLSNMPHPQDLGSGSLAAEPTCTPHQVVPGSMIKLSGSQQIPSNSHALFNALASFNPQTEFRPGVGIEATLLNTTESASPSFGREATSFIDRIL